MSEETGATSNAAETVELPTEKAPAERPNFTKQFATPRKTNLHTKAGALSAEKDLTGRSKKGVSKQIGKPSEEPQEKPIDFKKEETPTDFAVKPKEEKVEVKPPEPPKQAEPRMLKVKVNGVEQELPEDVVIRDYQIRAASDQKFREAAEMDKRNRALLEKLKSKEGIGEFLQAFGYDPRALAEEYLAEALNFELLSPEQKRIRQLEMENQRLSAAEKAKEQARLADEEAKITQHLAQQYQKGIIETLSGTDLPNTPETIRRMVRHLYILTDRGIPAQPKDVIDLVKEEIANENRSILSKMTPEQLIKYVPKEKLDEYRQWELSKLKNPVVPSKEASQPVKREPNQKRHYKTMEDWKASQRAAGIRR